jgi:hypothetical protein
MNLKKELQLIRSDRQSGSFSSKYLGFLCKPANIQRLFQPTLIFMHEGGHFDPKLPHKTANSDPNP